MVSTHRPTPASHGRRQVGHIGLGRPGPLKSHLSGSSVYFVSRVKDSANRTYRSRATGGCAGPTGKRKATAVPATYAGGLGHELSDTQTGGVKTYVNPQGTPFQPIQDTPAFATCP